MAKLPSGITKTTRYYRVRVTFEGTRHLVGDFHTLTDAKAALAIARGEIARGTFTPRAIQRATAKAETQRAKAEAAKIIQARTTVNQWSETWLTHLREAGRSDGTLVSYESTLRRHILPHIGDTPLAAVSQEEVDAMLRAVRTKGARTNVARTLRAMYRAAVADGVGGLEAVPFRLHVPTTAKVGTLDASQIATPSQVRDLCAALPPSLALAPMLAAVLSLRLGEVLGLQRRDFEDLDKPGGALVRVVRQWNSKTRGGSSYTAPKSGSSGVLAVPDMLVPLIVEHLEAFVAPEADAPLFASRGEKRPVSQTSFDKAWRAAREAAGMPGYRFHDLRHTGLTMYAQAGATLAEIMARGRHKHPEVAVRYQHATLERDRANAAVMGAAFGA